MWDVRLCEKFDFNREMGGAPVDVKQTAVFKKLLQDNLTKKHQTVFSQRAQAVLFVFRDLPAAVSSPFSF